MTDVMTKAQRSRCMSNIKGKNTGPELIVRKELWRSGFRYRLHYRVLGRPDFVFVRERIAVFIDGCFWHRCPIHFREPATNASAWKAKISGNVRRDRDVDARLKDEGWEVLRFWEHQVNDNSSHVVSRISKRIAAARRRLLKLGADGKS